MLALYSGAINHLFVISIHCTQYKTHECTHDLIAQVSQFYCRVQRHLSGFNVRPHTAMIVRDHMSARQIPGTEWPAYSPELNPIEQLWNQLGKAMRSIQSAGPTTNPTMQSHISGSSD